MGPGPPYLGVDLTRPLSYGAEAALVWVRGRPIWAWICRGRSSMGPRPPFLDLDQSRLLWYGAEAVLSGPGFDEAGLVGGRGRPIWAWIWRGQFCGRQRGRLAPPSPAWGWSTWLKRLGDTRFLFRKHFQKVFFLKWNILHIQTSISSQNNVNFGQLYYI